MAVRLRLPSVTAMRPARPTVPRRAPFVVLAVATVAFIGATMTGAAATPAQYDRYRVDSDPGAHGRPAGAESGPALRPHGVATYLGTVLPPGITSLACPSSNQRYSCDVTHTATAPTTIRWFINFMLEPAFDDRNGSCVAGSPIGIEVRITDPSGAKRADVLLTCQ
jgi:hypothetical protein